MTENTVVIINSPLGLVTSGEFSCICSKKCDANVDQHLYEITFGKTDKYINGWHWKGPGNTGDKWVRIDKPYNFTAKDGYPNVRIWTKLGDRGGWGGLLIEGNYVIPKTRIEWELEKKFDDIPYNNVTAYSDGDAYKDPPNALNWKGHMRTNIWYQYKVQCLDEDCQNHILSG